MVTPSEAALILTADLAVALGLLLLLVLAEERS